MRAVRLDSRSTRHADERPDPGERGRPHLRAARHVERPPRPEVEESGAAADAQGRRNGRLAVRGAAGPQRGAQRGGGAPPRGVRDGADGALAAAARLLRRRRAHRRHERQRRARVALLSDGARLRRRAVRTPGSGGRDRAGDHDAARLQRLAHRRMVRQAPGALHPPGDPADLGPRGDGPRGAARRSEGLPRHHVRRQSRRTRLSEPPRRALGSVLEGLLRRGHGRLHPHRLRHTPGHAGRECAGRDHDRRHADQPVQLRFRARVLGDLPEVPEAEGRALRGRDRLDPVLPGASRLRPPPPPPLDPARLPERQEAERRLPRAHHHLLHRRRGRACATAT